MHLWYVCIKYIFTLIFEFFICCTHLHLMIVSFWTKLTNLYCICKDHIYKYKTNFIKKALRYLYMHVCVYVYSTKVCFINFFIIFSICFVYLVNIGAYVYEIFKNRFQLHSHDIRGVQNLKFKFKFYLIYIIIYIHM